MAKLRIGVILDEEPSAQLTALVADGAIEVVGVYCPEMRQAAAHLAAHLGAPLVSSVADLCLIKGLEVLLNLSDHPGAAREVARHAPESVTRLGRDGLPLIGRLARAEDQLHKVTLNKQQLDAILETAQEGIQLADKDGTILYVNSAFTRITGVPAEQRVGHSCFDVSPDGALSAVLRSGAPVTGLRNRAKGSNNEVISNASPLYVGGELAGAVCVFQDVSTLARLTRQLHQSSAMIHDLSARLNQLQRAQYSFADIIGRSFPMREAIQTGRRAATSGSTVLILGESGTGKELFAHAIHQESRRSAGPFVALNCSAIPEQLLESELFGHEKGAFTGALRTKIGRFELAHGGTLFLDEIGDMSPTLQAKLLRILQEQRFERVGGVETIGVDVRIIAATNRDLRQRIQEGLFREDLYYRLNVMRVEIPPLRERREDLQELVHSLLQKVNRKLGTRVTEVDEATWGALLAYEWPGNVRELENLLERAVNMAEGPLLPHAPVARHVREGAVSAEVVPAPVARPDPVVSLAEVEREVIAEALRRFGSSTEGKRQAAKSLGISLSTLYTRLRQYGLMLH
ncbi:MAG: sigma-54 interaction domain-containing protein [Bacillota bacterium]